MWYLCCRSRIIHVNVFMSKCFYKTVDISAFSYIYITEKKTIMEFHETQRQLPVSIEAEQSVLGSILIDPDSLNQVADILTAESFSTEDHREIWLAIKELYLHDKNIDVVTLIDMLVKRGVYKNDEQGRTYIKVLAEIVPTSANIKDYAAIVRDKSCFVSLSEHAKRFPRMHILHRTMLVLFWNRPSSIYFKSCRETEIKILFILRMFL